jgi:hypothetical protein
VDGRVLFRDVLRGDLRFQIATHHVIFLLGILSFKGLTARRLYKSFGVKGLNGGVEEEFHTFEVFTHITGN